MPGIKKPRFLSVQKTQVMLLFFLSALGLIACAPSHLSLNEGIKSFQVQDYRSAFIRLKPEAEKAQPDAEYAVGYMYYYGQGVTEDRAKAMFWIARAAAKHQPDAVIAMQILNQASVPAPGLMKSQRVKQ